MVSRLQLEVFCLALTCLDESSKDHVGDDTMRLDVVTQTSNRHIRPSYRCLYLLGLRFGEFFVVLGNTISKCGVTVQQENFFKPGSKRWLLKGFFYLLELKEFSWRVWKAQNAFHRLDGFRDASFCGIPLVLVWYWRTDSNRNENGCSALAQEGGGYPVIIHWYVAQPHPGHVNCNEFNDSTTVRGLNRLQWSKQNNTSTAPARSR